VVRRSFFVDTRNEMGGFILFSDFKGDIQRQHDAEERVMRRSIMVLASLLAFLIVPANAPAQIYSITDLGTLGGSASGAFGINDSGQVVGQANGHAFLYQNGAMTDLGANSRADAISNSGYIVGEVGNHAFCYSSGSMVDLTVGLGWNTYTKSEAYGVNDLGQVVGYRDYYTGGIPQFPPPWSKVTGFLYSGGTMAMMSPPAGNNSIESLAINGSGQIVGVYYQSTAYPGSRPHAFLYSGGVFTTLADDAIGDTRYSWERSGSFDINTAGDVVGQLESGGFLYTNGQRTDFGADLSPNAINDAGQIVGQGSNGATLYQNGNFTDLATAILNNAGWTLTATDINIHGQIVGYGTTPVGQTHAFLLNPNPVVYWATNAGGTNLSAGSNWDGGVATGDIAGFKYATYANQPVVSAGGNAVNGLTVESTSGAATICGSGSLTVGCNGISVSSGAVGLNISAPITMAAAQIWANNALAVSGDNTLSVSGNVTNNSNNLIIDGAGNTSITGVIGGGSGGLLKSGNGRLTMGASHTYTGITTITGGTLSADVLADGGVASGIGASGNAAANLVLNGCTLQYTGGGGSTDRLFSVGPEPTTIDASGAGPLILGNAGLMGITPYYTSDAGVNLILSGSSTGNNTLAATISDAHWAQMVAPTVVTKSGSGRWVLTGNNNYSGGTNVNGGLIQAASLANLGNGGLIFDGGGLQFVNSTMDPSVRPMTFNAGGATLDTNGSDVNLANPIGDNGLGGLTKTGVGMLTLTAANTYTGVTIVEGGALRLNGVTNAQAPVLSGGGANIKAGKMIFDYTGEGTPAATIKGLLTTSYHAGAWDTGKFKSTAADANHGLGWIDDTTDERLTVIYTLYGDATVNGGVDLSDLASLGANWNTTGKAWSQGDFNYDGKVDLSDLAALGSHWNQSIAGFGTALDSTTAVPEPGSMVLLLAGGMAMLTCAWRRRRS
jgi:autotransporter-associated beta strand protein/probable HAF family extracellular repeat protein